ncbi:MAG TPA: preprotein translocase subunit YajC [Clostridiales bacterium UBA8153]|nr:preprotein translocase subunit YajC [Clostridiales bacterium UBA8153]
MAGLFYFLLIRPQQQQQKRRQAMLSALQAGDRIVTAGGIHGVVTKLKDETVLVRVAEKVEVEVQKGGIAAVVREDRE